MKFPSLIAGSLLLAATPGLAQDIAPAPPAEAAQPASPATFTDEQVTGFARAALALRALSEEAAAGAEQPDRQQRVQQILADSGMDVATFNALGQAVRTDTALQARVQAAIRAQAAPAAGR